MRSSFAMPLLSYIPLELGESIASSCCYSYIKKPADWGGIMKTQNGGFIDNRYTFSINPRIANIFGGPQNIPPYHYTYFYPNIYDQNYYDATAKLHNRPGYWAKEVVVSNPVGALNPSQLWVVDMGDVYEARPLPGSFVTLTMPYCDHTSGKCPFNQMTEALYHSQATMPHAMAGGAWWQTHRAQQYSS